MASTEPSNGATFPKIPPPPTGSSGAGSSSNKRLQQTQAKVDEVVGIMKVNVEKVLERDTKLSELDNRADALQHGASQFEQSATKLKRKQWWNNMKMMIIMGVIAIIILIIIIEYNRHGGCVTFKDEEMDNHRSFSGDDANNDRVEDSR